MSAQATGSTCPGAHAAIVNKLVLPCCSLEGPRIVGGLVGYFEAREIVDYVVVLSWWVVVALGHMNGTGNERFPDPV